MRARNTRLSVILLVLIILAATIAPTQAATVAAAPAQQQSQVKETILPNGLKVLTKEVHAAPVVSFQVWYKVGSRNEELGKTGLSHLLEHMQFKGTKSLKKGEIDKLIQSNGGISNAATWKDFTYYWETLSADKLELAMRIESDRMVNSLIDPKEFASEMTVVRSELEGDSNDPDTMIYYELYSNAFKAHPYQWPTIGWVHDVETVSRDDLYAYYKTFYEPNNATVVIVGDFDTDKALALVNKYFGKIKKGPEAPKVTALEPQQFGERRAVVNKAGSTYRVMMGYHVPAIGSPDVYPLDVLEIVLSSGMSSRLYKGLVDKQLATDAWASNTISRDPDLFLLGGTARDGVKIADVESALLSEVEKIKADGITDEELQKAVNQIEASFIYANDSVTNQADRLGNFETMYSWKYLDEYLPNLRKVTKEDVSRAARKYLTADNRTVVTFLPEEPGVSSQKSGVSAEPTGLKVRVPAYRPDSGSSVSWSGNTSTSMSTNSAPAKSAAQNPTPNIQHRTPNTEHLTPNTQNPTPNTQHPTPMAPTRVVLDNGMVVIFYPNHSNATVAVTGSMNAGGMFDPEGKNGLADLTAGLLVKGTKTRTADQLASERDYLGIRMGTGADTEAMSFSAYSLSKYFDKSLTLLSDVLRNPVFPDQELQKAKAIRLSGLKQQQDDPQSLAFRKFYGTVFPKGHPYHQFSIEEDAANTSAITRDDVVGFYNKYYGPQTAIIVVVGDVDEQTALTKIKQYFGDWKPTGPAVKARIPDTPLQTQVVKDVIQVPDKTQVDVVLGYSGGLKRTDPDFYSATIMNYILGGGGALGSRMGDVIRDQMGLVYTVYSGFDAQIGAGAWYSYLGTNPQNVDKAVSTLIDQMKLMREKGATEQEVKQAVDFITGSFPARRLETNASIADTLHSAEFYGLGMDYIRKYQSLYRAVTLEQVNAAAKKYLHPEQYTLIEAGTIK